MRLRELQRLLQHEARQLLCTCHLDEPPHILSTLWSDFGQDVGTPGVVQTRKSVQANKLKSQHKRACMHNHAALHTRTTARSRKERPEIPLCRLCATSMLQHTRPGSSYNLCVHCLLGRSWTLRLSETKGRVQMKQPNESCCKGMRGFQGLACGDRDQPLQIPGISQATKDPEPVCRMPQA